MRKLRRPILITTLALIAPLPLIAAFVRKPGYRISRDPLFLAQDDRGIESLSADIDGDGEAASIAFKTGAHQGTSLVISDGGRELISFPYQAADGTLLTHFAVTRHGNKNQLIAVDAIEPGKAAGFEWNGERMVQVPPADLQTEIARAVSTNDNGRWYLRILDELVRPGAVIIYYVITIFAFILFLAAHKARRDLSVMATSQ